MRRPPPREVILQTRPRHKLAWWPRVAGHLRWATVDPDGAGWVIGAHWNWAVTREDVDEISERFLEDNDGRWSFRILPVPV